MRQRRETAEHPFGTLKMRMRATNFLIKRLPKVATEMALHVLADNLARVMNIIGIRPLMTAIRLIVKTEKAACAAATSECHRAPLGVPATTAPAPTRSHVASSASTSPAILLGAKTGH